MSKKTIVVALNLDLLCRASFALVNCGSSIAEIGTYFLGRIEKET